ncbi:hypothetical protein BJ741DRAFT_594248 [Chytriomyces cf. hyalinus JEL632]|nr:hypothetical protein BJ741DRAFT_594248 [Chytriomyces cf. hyalinus JEL632]
MLHACWCWLMLFEVKCHQKRALDFQADSCRKDARKHFFGVFLIRQVMMRFLASRGFSLPTTRGNDAGGCQSVWCHVRGCKERKVVCVKERHGEQFNNDPGSYALVHVVLSAGLSSLHHPCQHNVSDTLTLGSHSCDPLT